MAELPSVIVQFEALTCPKSLKDWVNAVVAQIIRGIFGQTLGCAAVTEIHSHASAVGAAQSGGSPAMLTCSPLCGRVWGRWP